MPHSAKQGLATREQVRRWRDYMAKDPEASCNFGNMAYADTRLAVWDQERTLAELEARLGPSKSADPMREPL